jgi:hypothetical protein
MVNSKSSSISSKEGNDPSGGEICTSLSNLNVGRGRNGVGVGVGVGVGGKGVGVVVGGSGVRVKDGVAVAWGERRPGALHAHRQAQKTRSNPTRTVFIGTSNVYEEYSKKSGSMIRLYDACGCGAMQTP